MTYTDKNAEIIDRWVEEGWEWGTPITHEQFEAAKRGEWSIVLTPVKPVPRAWFGDLRGKNVLGLACGGGQQMPILSGCGAICTVMDYSPRQLQTEREVAEREGYEIHTVRADMTKPFPFADNAFDLIVHPVSNCYVREIDPIFRECFRVLKKGGILLCGLGNEVNYLVDDAEERIVHRMPFDPLVDETVRKELEESDSGMQFSHSVEDQIGGQLRAGFRLTDLFGDTNGFGRLHELNVQCYLATRSVKE